MRILFITMASHTESQKNMNHFQRVYFLSRNADLRILAQRDADFSASAAAGTVVSRARFGGKAGLMLHAFRCAVTGGAKDADIVLTEPSLLSLAGPLFKLFGAGRWVVDVWDVPGRMGGVKPLLLRAWLWLNRLLLKVAFRFADLFLLSIRPDREFAYFGVPSHRMHEMKNAIWLDDVMPPAAPVDSDRFDILCMRTEHHADMGLDTLAQAYVSLRERIAGTRLTIIGKIPDTVQSQVADLKDLPDVEFIDFVEHGALLRRIAASSVCVVPFKDVSDLAQTYPIKVIEYMALGKPVVASRIGGMSAMITDGEDGLLFRPGDADDLAERIVALRLDRELASRIADAARRSSARYDVRVKSDLILQSLEALVAPRHGAV